MTADQILSHAVNLALGIQMLALVATCIRVVRGPSLADRVLALDQLVAIAIGFIALIAIESGFSLYVDIAVALGLIGFLATAAFARYIYVSVGRREEGDAALPPDVEGTNER